MSYIVKIPISDNVYKAISKFMKQPDTDISPVIMRALTLYKFVKDIEAAGGEVNFKVKGESRKRIKIP